LQAFSHAGEGLKTLESRQIPQVNLVTPAKAGVQEMLKNLDSGFRRNDWFMSSAYSVETHVIEWIRAIVFLACIADVLLPI
jgi:hypothetical protein